MNAPGSAGSREPKPSRGLRGALAGVAVDLTPLKRSRDFRLLFGGQSVSLIGSQLTIVSVPYQVYLITHSSLAVGLLAFVQLVPMLAFSLLGGSLADIFDRLGAS